MAAIMGVEKIRTLLGEAVEHGCSMAWLDNGVLTIGTAVGEPSFGIDFVGERLTRIGAGRDTDVEPGPRHRQPPRQPRPPGDERHPVDDIDDGLAGSSVRQTGSYSFALEGKTVAVRSYKEMLVRALQMIERARPGTLERLSREKAKTKRVVARRPDLLYADPKLAKLAERIEGGWWVATNNSGDEVEKFVRRAAFHGGLHIEIRR